MSWPRYEKHIEPYGWWMLATTPADKVDFGMRRFSAALELLALTDPEEADRRDVQAAAWMMIQARRLEAIIDTAESENGELP